jgi:tetratricopeptide (TPR) repeat protein
MIWNNKGRALYYQGKYEEALQAFDEALRLDPELATAWNNKGFALYELGKHIEAVRAIDESVRLGCKHKPVWY